jgi:hypothetical protein
MDDEVVIAIAVAMGTVEAEGNERQTGDKDFPAVDALRSERAEAYPQAW